MSLSPVYLPEKESAPAPADEARLTHTLASHLTRYGEIYLLFALSAFLHLVIINKAIFNIDEVDFYGMARDAIITGRWPLTGSQASLGNLNPPLIMYLFMLPAAFSANPLWGQVMVALSNTLAVVLTYLFVRRYYGRLAGNTAALLYTTSIGAWTFSRNIWNPNFLPLAVMIFFFLLFRGVVERRQGWSGWAIFLMGIMYQLHASSLYLLLPLAGAVILAYKTINWRDILWGMISLLLLFSPYLVWEASHNFTDLLLVFHNADEQAQIDFEAWRLYAFYILPTLANPYLDQAARARDWHMLLPSSRSILIRYHLLSLLQFADILPIGLLVGSVALGLGRIFVAPFRAARGEHKGLLRRWWDEMQAHPARQGVALLLLWQLGALLLLTRHSIVLFVHYFIFFIPGPFILMAICTPQVVALMQKLRPATVRPVRSILLALMCILLLAQAIGMGGTLLDIDKGRFDNGAYSNIPDQVQVLQKVEQIAQQQRINRVMLATYPTNIKFNSLDYLAQQMPDLQVDFFNANSCFILPTPESGPVLFLINSGNQLAQAFFGAYAHARLIATSPWLGQSPYQIYLVSALPLPKRVASTFDQGLQLLSPQAELLQNEWLTTRWSVRESHPRAWRTTYNFQVQMSATDGGAFTDTLNCAPTLTQRGDQLFLFHTMNQADSLPPQISLQASTYIDSAQTISFGPLTGFTDGYAMQDLRTLRTRKGQTSLSLPTSIVTASATR